MDTKQNNILDDRRIRVLNFLLARHKIPENATFDLASLSPIFPRKIIAALQHRTLNLSRSGEM